MNKTVKRIVELLFEDVEVTDEIRAMKDEVMNNCQEHCADLMARGMSEDEAIGAVVESLKGMEEVIAGHAQRDKAEPHAGLHTFCSNAGVSRVEANVGACDITFEPNDEATMAVEWAEELADMVVCEQTGDTFRIGLKEEMDQVPDCTGSKNFNFNWNSLGDMFRDIAERGRRAVTITRSGWIKVAVPASVSEVKVRTTCGDIRLSETSLRKIELVSTSGDAEIKAANVPAADAIHVSTTSGDISLEGVAERMKLNTTSGDIEVEHANAGRAELNTMSGDISFSGECPVLQANSVSGEVNLEGSFGMANAKTVSGDVELDAADGRVDQVNIQTTSGDVDVILARHESSVHVEMKSVSGDMVNRVGDAGIGARVLIRVQTVSGSISID